MQQIQHEPETKGFNKARDFQDAVIRARKSGSADPLQVADAIYDWFMDASRTVQIATLQYAVSRIWSTTESKIADDETARDGEQQRSAPLVVRDRAKIRQKVRDELNRKWLDIVIPMTGAQVRAAKLLPDDMASKVGDAQRVGDVFTAAELRKVAA